MVIGPLHKHIFTTCPCLVHDLCFVHKLHDLHILGKLGPLELHLGLEFLEGSCLV